MIDLTKETPISLNEARFRLPKRRGNKRPDLATLYRWTSKGIQGAKDQEPIILEWIMVGTTRCTSIEALQRFCDALTEREQTHGIAAARARERAEASRMTKTRHDQIDAAERRLAAGAPEPRRGKAPANRPAVLRVHGEHGQLTPSGKRA